MKVDIHGLDEYLEVDDHGCYEYLEVDDHGCYEYLEVDHGCYEYLEVDVHCSDELMEHGRDESQQKLVTLTQTKKLTQRISIIVSLLFYFGNL